MNRNSLALLVAAALTLSLCGLSVLAADPAPDGDAAGQSQQTIADPGQPDAAGSEGAQPDASQPDATKSAEGGRQAPEGEAAAEDEAEDEAPAQPAPDAVGTLSFANLSSRLRGSNYNLLALNETIASVEAIDYDKMGEDLRKALNGIADLQWGLVVTGNSMSAMMLDQNYESLRDTFDDLKDGKLQADNAAVIRQLKNAQDQVVMAGESLYTALVEMELNDRSLQRSLKALDRTVEEMDLRYDLGQISALTLQEVKAGRTSLASTRQTLQSNITNYKTQLELMIGAELTGGIRLQGLPQVSKAELDAMNLDEDLAAAKQASYELFAAQRTLNDAQEDYKDVTNKYSSHSTNYQLTAAKHTWQAAQYTYSATVQNFESKFRTLYLQVQDYAQVYQASKTALALKESTYASMQLKYEQGAISQNKLLDAADEVSAAQATVDGAAIDLFSAYHNYRWAVDYGILN